VIGDGEAETGPLAASWHSTKLLNPRRDGAVLPILHLNGFKIANPTVLARVPEADLASLLRGYGYAPHFVEGDDPPIVHQALAASLETVLADIRAIQARARTSPNNAPVELSRWPMIVLKTPKGWTGPKFVDGLPVEGAWRSHQVPLTGFDNPDHVTKLQDWLLSYRPRELFDAQGKFREEYAAIAPTGHNEPARLAMEMYVYAVRKQIAAMVAALEGVDLLVFTGGIGESDAEARGEICDGLRWLGPHNVRVLAASEEEQIARHAIRLTR
jgi:xylulose-5-phosphate/fructose-6-phosphate phosphoketolase